MFRALYLCNTPGYCLVNTRYRNISYFTTWDNACGDFQDKKSQAQVQFGKVEDLCVWAKVGSFQYVRDYSSLGVPVIFKVLLLATVFTIVRIAMTERCTSTGSWANTRAT